MRVRPNADIAGADTGDEVSVELQVNYSIVDSATPVYQGWRRFVVGDYTARHLKVRAVLKTLFATISPTISTGADSWMVSQIASRPTSRTSAPVMIAPSMEWKTRRIRCAGYG
jgi:hypothetical protein